MTLRPQPEGLECGPGGCTEQVCCLEPTTTVGNDPCAPVARKYSANEEVVEQGVAKPKQGAGAIAGWVMPFFGVLGLISFVAVAKSLRTRAKRSTRNVVIADRLPQSDVVDLEGELLNAVVE